MFVNTVLWLDALLIFCSRRNVFEHSREIITCMFSEILSLWEFYNLHNLEENGIFNSSDFKSALPFSL